MRAFEGIIKISFVLRGLLKIAVIGSPNMHLANLIP